MNDNIAVIDTETTSLEGAVCEIAAVSVNRESLGIDEWYSTLIDPGVPISFGAMAIHHITPDMVVNEPKLSEVLENTIGAAHCSVYAAHNAEFDKGKLPEAEQYVPWICTMRCAKHLYPNLEAFGNQVIRYELGLDVSDMPADAGNLPHRALYDAWVTAKLLCRMLAANTVDDLISLTNKPVLLKQCSFGMHRGKDWADVPKDYLQWARKQDFDEDTMHTINFHLGTLL